MSKDKGLALQFITSGNLVILRGWLANDCDHFVRWWIHGEWQRFDAPWEGIAEDEKHDREWFMGQLNRGDKSWLNKRAVITTLDNIPLGWVSRYAEKMNPHVWFVGIDICEDTYFDRGLGTEALRLWVDHLFAISDIHKLGLDTWSFNPRMIRVAEKVGFAFEDRQRKMRRWQGEWLDLLHFGLLREDWQRNNSAAGGQK